MLLLILMLVKIAIAMGCDGDACYIIPPPPPRYYMEYPPRAEYSQVFHEFVCCGRCERSQDPQHNIRDTFSQHFLAQGLEWWSHEFFSAWWGLFEGTVIWQVQDLEERIFWDTRQILVRLGVLNEQDNYPLQMKLSYDYLARAQLRGVYCPFFLAQEAMHILKCNKQMPHVRKQLGKRT